MTLRGYRVSVLLLSTLGGTVASGASHPAASATKLALERIARANPCLHAVIAINPAAMAEARDLDRDGDRGPLAGRPILVKDNIETSENATTAGSLALAGNKAGRDAPLVGDLRRAGAIIVGKANMSEWAKFRGMHQISGWSAVGGQTHNPYDLARTPGGSSSGSAVAVAAGLVDFAIGTDTGGSITVPASYNGVVGFRPTVGRVSRTSVIPIAASFDTPGPITRTVRDAALVMDAVSKPDPSDPASAAALPPPRFAAELSKRALEGVRLGVLQFDAGRSPASDKVFARALDVLRAAGATLVDIRETGVMPETDDDEWKVMMTEFKTGLNAYLHGAAPAVRTRSLPELIAFNQAHAAQEMPLFGQEVFIEAEGAAGLDNPSYRAARTRARRNAGPNFVDRLLREANVSALVAPTAEPAPPIHRSKGDPRPAPPIVAERAAVAGYPHLTVPMGSVDGLPVGLSFIGTKWSDDRLLNYGYAYEQARGTSDLVRPSINGDSLSGRSCLKANAPH